MAPIRPAPTVIFMRPTLLVQPFPPAEHGKAGGGSAGRGGRLGRGLACLVSSDGDLSLALHAVRCRATASSDTANGLAQVTAPRHLMPIERTAQHGGLA
jgi:hypothetical protein